MRDDDETESDGRAVHTSTFWAALVMCMIMGLPSSAQVPSKPVTFTNAQAERGRDLYVRSCVDCHGHDLDNGEFGGAPLRGSHFRSRWGDAPAENLFAYLSATMPPDRPGQLSTQTYADIMAYMLMRNGYQAGSQDLPGDLDALGKMTIER